MESGAQDLPQYVRPVLLLQIRRGTAAQAEDRTGWMENRTNRDGTKLLCVTWCVDAEKQSHFGPLLFLEEQRLQRNHFHVQQT